MEHSFHLRHIPHIVIAGGVATVPELKSLVFHSENIESLDPRLLN